MKQQFTTLTRKGQITVPAEIRHALGLEEGDKVIVSLAEGEQRATLTPVRSIAELTFGSVKPRRRPEDFDELRRIFEEEVAMDVAREASPDSTDMDLA